MKSPNSRPAPLSDAAYYGLAGEFTRAIEPESEADPAAILVTLLLHYGNIIGRSAHVNVGGTRHRANVYAVFVGPSGFGRKGTAQRAIAPLFGDIDSVWSADRVKSGLSSGEGIITAVRDAIWIPHAKKNGNDEIEDYYRELIDGGIEDKRLMVIQEEFSAVLRMFERDGNILSNVIRQGWDGESLETMTKNPMKATDPHISIIGHISKDELLRRMNTSESANGFGNRFLWMWVERSKYLPEGGRLADEILAPLRKRLNDAVEFGNSVGRIERDGEASELWASEYVRLSSPGLAARVGTQIYPIPEPGTLAHRRS